MRQNDAHQGRDPELEALRRWIAARRAAVLQREADEAEIARCAGVLTAPASDEGAILHALVVLAGSPVRVAGEALRRYREAPHPGFAYLATQAWEEWQFWSPAPLGRVA